MSCPPYPALIALGLLITPLAVEAQQGWESERHTRRRVYLPDPGVPGRRPTMTASGGTTRRDQDHGVRSARPPRLRTGLFTEVFVGPAVLANNLLVIAAQLQRRASRRRRAA